MSPSVIRALNTTSKVVFPSPASGNGFQCLYTSARQHLYSTSAAQKNHMPSISRASERKLCSQGCFATRKYHSLPQPSHSFPPRPIHRSQLPNRSTQRGYKTVEGARSGYKIGPFSIISVVVFLSTGLGMIMYFRYEKARVERKRIADASKGVGKPKVGGKFELVDQEGRVWKSEEEMGGKFSLVYFGFTHCPDICPEELDKMASMLDLVNEALPSSNSQNPPLLPLFITCDPARDTPSVLKTYLKEFHPNMIGLTGTWEQIKAVCKLYRVYFSTPQGVQPGMDYLVDHSIYFYLMDPDGDFVEAIGRTHSAEKAARIIAEHMGDWKGKIKQS